MSNGRDNRRYVPAFEGKLKPLNTAGLKRLQTAGLKRLADLTLPTTAAAKPPPAAGRDAGPGQVTPPAGS